MPSDHPGVIIYSIHPEKNFSFKGVEFSMTSLFKCPGCGGPLKYEEGGGSTITCPYCSNSVIVPVELRGSGADAKQFTVSPISPEGRLANPEELKGKIRELRQNRRETRRLLRHQAREERRGGKI
jgi:hypothetical protein